MISVIIKTNVIIYIIGYSNTVMERTCKRAEYVICLVPYHQEVLRVHQSHFCLRVVAEDRGFQSDLSDIQRESEQICQAELRELGNCSTCQRFPDGFCSNPGR